MGDKDEYDGWPTVDGYPLPPYKPKPKPQQLPEIPPLPSQAYRVTSKPLPPEPKWTIWRSVSKAFSDDPNLLILIGALLLPVACALCMVISTIIGKQ